MINFTDPTPIAGNPALLTDLESSFSTEEVQSPQVVGRTRQYLLRRNGEALRIWAETPEPAWLRESLQQLQRLLRLEVGWDSYGGLPIKFTIIRSALFLLDQIAPDTLQAPSIVPTPAGGVQLEWHKHGLDIEIEVTSASHASFYIADIDSGEEWENEIKLSLPMEGVVNQALSRLIN